MLGFQALSNQEKSAFSGFTSNAPWNWNLKINLFQLGPWINQTTRLNYTFIRSCEITFLFTKCLFKNSGYVTKNNKTHLLTSFYKKFLKKFENLSTNTDNCKIVCKIFIQTKLTDFLYYFLLYFRNFQEDFL